MLLVTIGLDDAIVELVTARIDGRVVSYPSPPRVEVVEGRARTESRRVAGKFVEPDGILFYSYFDDAGDVRRALAIASTPTFPDVRATLPLDDKIVALAMATRADGVEVPRGYVTSGASASWEGERVVKWGQRHCGEGKTRATGGFSATEPTVVEPFVAGTSERILIIGERAWHLRYESDDWRKNVRATVSVVEPASSTLVERARRTAAALGLAVTGVDYVVAEDRTVLLEVNAYPGLDDAPGAADALADLVAGWWRAIG